MQEVVGSTPIFSTKIATKNKGNFYRLPERPAAAGRSSVLPKLRDPIFSTTGQLKLSFFLRWNSCQQSTSARARFILPVRHLFFQNFGVFREKSRNEIWIDEKNLPTSLSKVLASL